MHIHICLIDSLPKSGLQNENFIYAAVILSTIESYDFKSIKLVCQKNFVAGRVIILELCSCNHGPKAYVDGEESPTQGRNSNLELNCIYHLNLHFCNGAFHALRPEDLRCGVSYLVSVLAWI